MISLLGHFPGLHRVLEVFVAAQIMAFALEADAGFPLVCAWVPIHTGHAAGVVFPDGLGPQQLDARAVYIGAGGLAAAAGLPAPQMAGHDHELLAAVAPAPPRGHGSDVFRRLQHRQHTEPLSGQLQPLIAVISGNRGASLLDRTQPAWRQLPRAGVQEGLEHFFLRPPPGLHGILQFFIAAQVAALPLEADGSPPAPLGRQPVHSGHTAGVVAADRSGADHLHAGPIDIGQAGPSDGGRGLSEKLLVAAA